MKIKRLLFCLALIGAIAISAQTQKESTSATGANIGGSFTNLAREYFTSGVVSAMYAHQKWVNGKLINGVIPDAVGMPTKEWKQAAIRVWLETNPKEHYIKLELENEETK